jgi:cytochrome c2
MINVKKITFAVAMAAVVAIGSTAVTSSVHAADGKKAFKKCQTCHDNKFKKNKIGPNLAGIVGKAAGAVDGFKYSQGMKDAAAGGLIWTEENLLAFIINQKDFMKNLKVKKSKMRFTNYKKKPALAKAVVEYLKTK